MFNTATCNNETKRPPNIERLVSCSASTRLKKAFPTEIAPPVFLFSSNNRRTNNQIKLAETALNMALVDSASSSLLSD